MDEMAQTDNYQGVIAVVPPFEYCEIEDILEYANEKEESPFVLILDGIIEAYKHLIKNLCKNGMPEGNVYDYCSEYVKNFERI